MQVLVAKSDSLYAVAMLEAGELAVLPVADYHCPLRTVADAIGAGADLEVCTYTYIHTCTYIHTNDMMTTITSRHYLYGDFVLSVHQQNTQHLRNIQCYVL